MSGRSSSSTEGWPLSESLLGDTEPDVERFEGDREPFRTRAVFRRGYAANRGSAEGFFGGR
jgi:hypothetical protein